MAITITFNTDSVTLDETSGLQFLNSPDNTVAATDNDDNDVARTALPTPFSDRLFVDLGLPTAFPDLVGVATGTIATVTSDSTPITDVAFDFTDGASSGFFDLDDNEIFLFHDATDPNIVLLREGNGTLADSAGAIVGAIYLDVDADGTSTSETVDVWLVQFEAFANVNPLDPDDTLTLANLALSASSTISFDFTGAPSGSNLFMMFGDPTSTQIVVIGENPLNQSQGGNINTKDVLNISQAGSTTSFGVNGQALNDSAGHPTEGAFITYVTGATTNFLVPNLDQNEADLEQNIQFQDVVNATSASFTVNQTNPGVGPVTVKITAFSTAAEQGVNYVDGLTNDTKVNIQSASVVDFVVKAGNTQFTPVATVNPDGTLTITGLSTGDEVQWTTDGTHNRVLIENISAHDGISGNDNNTFDIGGFTITRAQGDSAPIPNILFDDDGPAIDLTPTTATIAVDESVGTGGSSQDEPGNAAPDDETAVGAPVGAIGYAVTSAATLFSETADAGSDGQASKAYALVLNAGATGLTDTATGDAVVLSLVGGVVEGHIATGNALVFTIAVNSTTGAVTTTQFRALDHGDDSNDHDSAASMASGLVELQATLTDGDTDTGSDKIELGSRIGFEDDGPAVTVDDATGTYAAGAAGTWDQDPGTDGFGSLGVTFDSYQIDSHGSGTGDVTFTKTGDFAFEGSITDDFNNDGTDETVDFTLIFDPANPETYDLQVTTPPTTVVKFNTSQGNLPPGGPDEVQTLFFGGPGGGNDIVFFGVVATAPIQGLASPPVNDIQDLVVVGATDLTELQINALLPLPTLITPGTEMNVSTSGIGVNNNNLNGANQGAGTGTFAGTTITSGDESFVVNPETVVDNVRVFIDNSVGGYNVATEDLYYTVYYTDGTVSGPTNVTNPLAVPAQDPNNEFPDPLQGHGQYFDIDGGDKQIDAVQLTMGLGTIKIPVIEFSVEQAFTPEPVDLNFTATLVDGDGDSQQDSFSVHVLV